MSGLSRVLGAALALGLALMLSAAPLPSPALTTSPEQASLDALVARLNLDYVRPEKTTWTQAEVQALVDSLGFTATVRVTDDVPARWDAMVVFAEPTIIQLSPRALSFGTVVLTRLLGHEYVHVLQVTSHPGDDLLALTLRTAPTGTKPWEAMASCADRLSTVYRPAPGNACTPETELAIADWVRETDVKAFPVLYALLTADLVGDEGSVTYSDLQRLVTREKGRERLRQQFPWHGLIQS